MSDFDFERERSHDQAADVGRASNASEFVVGPTDAGAEREADRMASSITAAMRSAPPGSPPSGNGKVRSSGAGRAAPLPGSDVQRRVQRSAAPNVIRRWPGSKVAQATRVADPAQIALEVERECRAELRAYLLRGLGGGGAHWWRSSEVRKFRQALKDAARTQAYQDFDVAVAADEQARQRAEAKRTGKSLVSDKSARRDLQELIGANVVYDDAKQTVDEVLDEMVDDLLNNQVLDTDDNRYSLSRPARRAAADSYGKKPNDEGAARRAAKKAVAKPQAALKSQVQELKDKYTGKRIDGKLAGDNWAMTAEGKKLQDHVVDEVKDRGVGRKSLDKAIEADSMSRGLIVLGDIIDTILTGPGETLDLSIEFRIPVTTGVVVILKLQGMAAKGTNGASTAGVTVLGKPERVEISAKFSVGAGADAPGINVDGTVGFFVRAGSDKGSRAALQALSYGAYRAAPGDDLKNLWAPPDKRGKVDPTAARSKTERAETWAAAVEQSYFGEDDGAFAHVGLGADGAVGVNAGFAEFEVGFGSSTFAKYDRDSLAASGSLGDSFGASLGSDPASREAAAKQRRKDAHAGVGVSAYLSLSASIKAGLYQFEVSASGSGALGLPPNWGIEITFAVGTPSGVATPNVADTLLNGFLGSVGDIVKQIQSALNDNPEKNEAFGKFGQGAVSATSLVDARTQGALTNAIKGIASTDSAKSGTDFGLDGPKPDEALTKSEEIFGVSSQTIFVLTFGQSDGKWVCRVELRNKRGIAIGNSSTVAKFEGSKTTRLFAGGTDADGPVLEIAGARFDDTDAD